MQCPKCNKELENDSKYCVYCGANIQLSLKHNEERFKRIKLIFCLVLIVLIIPIANFSRELYLSKLVNDMFERGTFVDSNFTNDEIYRLLRDAQAQGITSQAQLSGFVRNRGFGSINQHFSFTDKGEIRVFIYNKSYNLIEFGLSLHFKPLGLIDKILYQ